MKAIDRAPRPSARAGLGAAAASSCRNSVATAAVGGGDALDSAGSWYEATTALCAAEGSAPARPSAPARMVTASPGFRVAPLPRTTRRREPSGDQAHEGEAPKAARTSVGKMPPQALSSEPRSGTCTVPSKERMRSAKERVSAAPKSCGAALRPAPAVPADGSASSRAIAAEILSSVGALRVSTAKDSDSSSSTAPTATSLCSSTASKAAELPAAAAGSDSMRAPGTCTV
mmetsp:Transcript_26905/g.58645  ORF Transcript_26905/g.58645 Transcript_26905/m.58645 type:complete len:230 (-) Transcript_26905:963-1652(-)